MNGKGRMGMWRYQSFGEEFGPVTTDVLVELLRSEVVGPADLVCREGEPWQPAGEVPELQAALSSNALPEVEDPELLQLLNQVGGSPVSTTSDRSASSPPPATHQWFAEILGQELGPFDWEALTVMVGRGELSPTDRVRRGPAGAWQRADEIVGLFPESALSPPSWATAVSPGSTAAEEATWFVEEEGRPRGPYSYQTLRSLAAAGRLGPRDRIREGPHGPWLRAATLTGLFAELTETRSLSGLAERTVRPDDAARTDAPPQANVVNPAVETPAENAAAEAGSANSAPARDEWDEFFESVEARERRKWRRESAGVSRSAAAWTSPTTSPAPLPAPSSAPPSSSAEPPSSPTVTAPSPPAVTAPAMTAPAAATPPTFVAPRSPKRSLSLPSLNLSELFANLRGAAGGGLGLKLLIPLLVGASLAAWQLFPGLFRGTPGREFYEPIEQLWQQVIQLHVRGAPAEEWQALAASSQPLLDDAQQQLAPIVAKQGIKAPLAQRLLWMVDKEDGPTRAKGYLRKALDSGGRIEGGDIMTGNALMSEAASFLPR